MERINKLYIFIICVEILLLSVSLVSGETEAIASEIHPVDPGNDCISCHKGDFDPIENESRISIPGGTSSNNVEVVNILNEPEFGPDCVFCHFINDAKHIDASAIKQGVHGNLNSGASNSTVLSDLVDKACWACHGNGTESTSHPINNQTPYSCEDCHSKTINLTSTNTSRIPDLTSRKVSEHIQPPFFEQINSTINNSNANCEGCHDKSKVTFSDIGLSRAANVSHYASRTDLVKPSVNCSLCHKNSTNASGYWANTIRHPARSQEDSFCHNCHNTTTAIDLHSQPLVKPNNIHTGFDWQDDDSSEINPLGENEACMSCHDTHYTVYKICEDCHIENRSGPVKGYYTRPDINDTLPLVYAHTNFSTEVIVPNQSLVYSPSDKAKTFSSCYSFNNVTLEGTCHGNSYKNISANGGFYAFKRISVDVRSTPYHFTQTIDRLPDTTNCVFCHNQTDAVIRKAWGNATQITSERHSWYTGSNNSKCWSCHVNTGNAPRDFHSDSVTAGGGSDCILCHSPNDVNTSKFARHANLNISDGGQDNVTNSDCWACHYQKDMDKNHVYMCDSCHENSSGIVNVTDPALIKNDFMHGITLCKTCHAPKGYHGKGTVGPLGIVENILKKMQQ
jgi:nitrate/TMAO reductase-like tetraheme cytochrome c subunit